MPVDSTHASFERRRREWKIMRDTAAGELTVKAAGEEYLPRLDGQPSGQYEGYKERAQFFNATGRTMQALEGCIFRKDPEVIYPDALKPFAQDATLQGMDWWAYQKDVVRNVLEVGRHGTLVDFDPVAARPYVTPYTAEQIINWKMERIGGRVVLSLLVLREESPKWLPVSEGDNQEREPDRYEHQTFPQWREYQVRLDAQGQPYVFFTVWRQKKGREKEFVAVEQGTPTRRGQPLARIPFVFHGPHNSLPDTDKVPLLDLAMVNLSLYRTSADLEHGRHWTGLPTPYLCGFEGIKEIVLGSTAGLISERPEANAGFLEFSGSGLSALSDAVAEKQKQMAALAARMMEPESSQAETATAVLLKNSAQNSALENLTVSCSDSLSQVLCWVGWWTGTEADPQDLSDTHKVELNTEFVAAPMAPDLLDKLRAAYEAGSYPLEAYVQQLRKGELLPPDKTDEEVQAQIEQDRASRQETMMGAGTGSFGGGGGGE